MDRVPIFMNVVNNIPLLSIQPLNVCLMCLEIALLFSRLKWSTKVPFGGGSFSKFVISSLPTPKIQYSLSFLYKEMATLEVS